MEAGGQRPVLGGGSQVETELERGAKGSGSQRGEQEARGRGGSRPGTTSSRNAALLNFPFFFFVCVRA